MAGKGRLWIIDPLDGTREFRQLGRSDWAVHVAMAVGGVARRRRGGAAGPRHGALARPTPRSCRRSAPGERPRVVVSRSRPPDVAYEVTEAIGGVMVPMGSAGAKIAAVDPRRGRGLRARRAASTSGTRAPRWRWPRPAGCTPAGSTGSPCATATPTRGCPTSSSAGRSMRTPSWRSPPGSTAPTGRHRAGRGSPPPGERRRSQPHRSRPGIDRTPPRNRDGVLS